MGDVPEGKVFIDLIDGFSFLHQVSQISVIIGASGYGLFKDRGVGGDPANSGLDEGLHLP